MTIFMYIFCLLVWGLNFIVIKIQGNTVNPQVSLLYRLVIAALIFCLFFWFSKKKQIILKNDIFFILIFGICNFALSYLCLYYATILISSATVVLIFSLKSIITPIFLRVFSSIKIQPRIIIGGILGILGVIILIYPNINLNYNVDFLKGIILAFIGTLVTALGDTASARNAKRGINPLFSNFLGFSVASLILFTICLFNGTTFDFQVSITYIGSLIYLSIIASFFAWLFYLKLVEKIGASLSGYMVALFPIIGGVASVIYGESRFDLNLFIACTLCSLGAACALGIRFFLFKISKEKTIL